MFSDSTMKRALLTSASVAVLTLVSGTARAQDAAPAPVVPAASTPADAATDEIVVTGIRGSIQRAQELKRDASGVIEAVTFEDLGKFSDVNIADALQRVPGLQIERNDSGSNGDRASIRGLGPEFTSVTVNDRTLVSYGDSGRNSTGIRSFNFDQVPSEVIGGLTVYKTPIAETVEPGIGGLVNIQTLRPLDYRPPSGSSYFGSLSAKGEIDSIGKSLEPRISGLVGAKFFGDTLGVYFSGLYANTRSRTDTLISPYNPQDLTFTNANGIGTTTIPNVLTPTGVDFYTNSFERKRRTGSVGVQWKPTSEIEVNADFTYNKYNNDQTRNVYSWGATSNGIYASPIAPGDVTVENGAVTAFNGLRNGVIAQRVSSQGQFNDNDSTLKYGGINVKWTHDRIEVAFDYGHSDVKYFSQFAVAYGNDQPQPFNYALANGIPTIIPVGGAINYTPNAQAYYWYDEEKALTTGRDSFKLDGKYRFSDDWVLKLGVRHERTSVDSRTGATFAFLPRSLRAFGFGNPDGTESFGTAREFTFTQDQINRADGALFPGGNIQFFPQLNLPSAPVNDIRAFCGVLTQLCGQDIRTGSLYRGAFPTSSTPPAGDTTNDIAISPLGSFAAQERNTALYGSLDGKGELFGVPLDGNVGIRAVNIHLFTQAFAAIRNTTADGAVLSDVTGPSRASNDYWEVLPNLNINLHPNDRMNVRVGVARSMSLPEYIDTAPLGTLSIVDPTSRNYNPTVNRNTAVFGIATLKPITAWNYDLTLEYYTKNNGSIVFSAFYKDISNIILRTRVQDVAVPGQTVLFDLLGPVNVPKAYARGFEIGLNQPFTFLPAPFDGFGVQANYTFVDTKIKSSLGTAQFGIPGSSKHNVNVVAYYEKYGLGVRVGYTYRTKNLLGVQEQTASLEDPISNLNLNVSYKVTSFLEINGSIDNITGENRRDYTLVSQAPVSYYQRPTSYSFGARLTY